MAERLQKWLAGTGRGSRREIERWIVEGRIEVDGKAAVLGQKVTGQEHITIDGKAVRAPSPGTSSQTIIYHKPPGEICSRKDPQGRPSVFDALPKLSRSRWISVGRLDLNTAGLLLFTEDGDLANKLMHPSSGIEREYACRVQGNVTDELLSRLRHGVDLEDGPARFNRVEFAGGEGTNRWYRVIVTEGRNRLIRRAWEAADCRVTRLIRVRFGPVSLPRNLSMGKSRRLDAAALDELRRAGGL